MSEEMNKEPLSKMDKTALDAQLEVMKKAAKLSETDKAMERSKNIADLKAILQILTHFNETKQKLQDLPKEIPPRKVEEPEYIDNPVFTATEPVLKKGENLRVVLGVLLAALLIAVFKFNVFGDVTYANFMSFDIGTLYTITEIDLLAIVFVIGGFVGRNLAKHKNQITYEAELSEYTKERDAYSAEVTEISEKNDAMHNAFVEEEEKAKAEADEKNKLTHLQSMSYQTTLKHLEADYMKKYSRYIPSEKLDIPYIKELIRVIERQDAQTIRGAVMFLSDKEESQEKGE